MYKLVKINEKFYIENYSGKEKFIKIPKEIDGKEIYGINSLAFMDIEAKEILISEGIKDIKENAFIGCENLETVFLENIPDKYTNLDECFQKDTENILFLNCNERNFTLYVTSKYSIMRFIDIFKDKNTIYEELKTKIIITDLPKELEEIYIPDIYNDKEVYLNLKMNFYDELRKLRIPKNNSSTIAEFHKLQEIIFSSETIVANIPFALELRNIIIYEKLEKIKATNFLKELEKITIDEENNLKDFPIRYFKKSKWFENIKTNSSGEKIYKGILLVYSLEKLAFFQGTYDIPKEVKFIANEVFFEETDLKEILLNTTERIGAYAFTSTRNLTKVFFPKSIKYIGEKAFSSNKSFLKKEFDFEEDYKKITIEKTAL